MFQKSLTRFEVGALKAILVHVPQTNWFSEMLAMGRIYEVDGINKHKVKLDKMFVGKGICF